MIRCPAVTVRLQQHSTYVICVFCPPPPAPPAGVYLFLCVCVWLSEQFRRRQALSVILSFICHRRTAPTNTRAPGGRAQRLTSARAPCVCVCVLRRRVMYVLFPARGSIKLSFALDVVTRVTPRFPPEQKGSLSFFFKFRISLCGGTLDDRLCC